MKALLGDGHIPQGSDIALPEVPGAQEMPHGSRRKGLGDDRYCHFTRWNGWACLFWGGLYLFTIVCIFYCLIWTIILYIKWGKAGVSMLVVGDDGLNARDDKLALSEAAEGGARAGWLSARLLRVSERGCCCVIT